MGNLDSKPMPDAARKRAIDSTRVAPAAVGLVLLAALAGCRVHVDKSANGDDKNVQVDTPFGGLHVNTDQTTAADLGLPVYPGAKIAQDSDNDKSADVHMGFGQWELRVKVVNYVTSDSQDKVTAFYRKALGRYGDVIACQNDKPVGAPAATSEGLTCQGDSKHGTSVQIGNGGYHYGPGDEGFELKAGSKRRQHIVGFQSAAPGQTRFALVALDLPAFATSGSD